MTESGEVHLDKFNTTLVQGTSTESVAAMYDDWADKFDEDNGNAGYDGPSKMAEIFSEVCHDKNCEIVDWAAGTGLCGAKLHDNGYTNLTAADISEKILEVASKKKIYKRLEKLGDSKLIFRNNEFDAVVCSGGIIPNHVTPDILHEWARIVKPGGLIANVMRREYIHLTEGHEQYYSEELKLKLEEVIKEMQNEKKLDMISKKDFIGYHKLPPIFHGRSFVFKVLS